MRNKKLKKRGYKIDTTNFPFGKIGFLRDPEYLKSFENESCFVCKIKDGTVVGAHIRSNGFGGVGLKTSDSSTIGLCFKCHSLQHEIGEKKFWERNGYTISAIKNIALNRYKVYNDESG